MASRDARRAEAWAAERGVPRAFGDYASLIDSGEADALYVALPNSLHHRWTLRALRAGIPVLCEKPLAATAEEAAEVARLSRSLGVPVAEAFMHRFHPLYDRLRALLAEGAIGEATLVRAAFTFLLEDRSETPASAELAGGALLDVGCYGVNLARWAAGEEPARVAAFARRTTVDDTLVGILEFPGGMLAQIDCGIENEERQSAEIVGTRGAIVLPSPWRPGLDRGELLLRRGGAETRVETAGGDCYALEIEDFARALGERRDPRWPVEDAVRNMAVCDALARAARGRTVEPVSPPAL